MTWKYTPQKAARAEPPVAPAPGTAAAPVSPLPWHPFLAVLFVFGLYFGTAILGEGVLLAISYAAHLRHISTAGWDTNTVVQFIYVFVVEGLTVWGLYAFMKGYKTGFRALGLIKPRLRDAGVALVAIGPYFAVYVALIGLATFLFPSINIHQPQQLGFNPHQSSVGLVLAFASLVIMPPLVEEILFRGYLFGSLRKTMPVWLAILITSVIFASGHLQIGSGAPLLWAPAIDTFTLSIALCYMRYKTGSLWPGITLHALKNTVAFMGLFVFHLS